MAKDTNGIVVLWHLIASAGEAEGGGEGVVNVIGSFSPRAMADIMHDQ